MIRKAAVSGQFYSHDAQEIQKQITHFNQLLDEHLEDKTILDKPTKMIIVPHAGYIYSGFTANIAHRIMATSKVKRVIVIGPSHRVYISGASIALHDNYETPYGVLGMDKAYAQKIKASHGLMFEEDAHYEHSTETQMPFIKHYLPQVQVCEIVYGDISYQKLSSVIETVLEDEDNVVVISTDLSHFYTLDKANRLDKRCLEAIKQADSQKLGENGCEACGKTGVMAALDVAKKHAFKVEVLDYRTSADVTGDRDSVVGYMSAIIG